MAPAQWIFEPLPAGAGSNVYCGRVGPGMLGLSDCSRHRCGGRSPAYDVGLLPRQLCVLDRHLARWHVDLGNSPAHRRRLAQTGDTRGRGHHRVCFDDRGDVSHHPSGTPVDFLLAVSLSEFAIAVAELPVAIVVGCDGDLHLFERQRDLPVPAADSRSRGTRRSTPLAGGAVYTSCFLWAGREAIANGTRWSAP